MENSEIVKNYDIPDIILLNQKVKSDSDSIDFADNKKFENLLNEQIQVLNMFEDFLENLNTDEVLVFLEDVQLLKKEFLDLKNLKLELRKFNFLLLNDWFSDIMNDFKLYEEKKSVESDKQDLESLIDDNLVETYCMSFLVFSLSSWENLVFSKDNNYICLWNKKIIKTDNKKVSIEELNQNAEIVKNLIQNPSPVTMNKFWLIFGENENFVLFVLSLIKFPEDIDFVLSIFWVFGETEFLSKILNQNRNVISNVVFKNYHEKYGILGKYFTDWKRDLNSLYEDSLFEEFSDLVWDRNDAVGLLSRNYFFVNYMNLVFGLSWNYSDLEVFYNEFSEEIKSNDKLMEKFISSYSDFILYNSNIKWNKILMDISNYYLNSFRNWNFLIFWLDFEYFLLMPNIWNIEIQKEIFDLVLSQKSPYQIQYLNQIFDYLFNELQETSQFTEFHKYMIDKLIDNKIFRREIKNFYVFNNLFIGIKFFPNDTFQKYVDNMNLLDHSNLELFLDISEKKGISRESFDSNSILNVEYFFDFLLNENNKKYFYDGNNCRILFFLLWEWSAIQDVENSKEMIEQILQRLYNLINSGNFDFGDEYSMWDSIVSGVSDYVNYNKDFMKMYNKKNESLQLYKKNTVFVWDCVYTSSGDWKAHSIWGNLKKYWVSGWKIQNLLWNKSFSHNSLDSFLDESTLLNENIELSWAFIKALPEILNPEVKYLSIFVWYNDFCGLTETMNGYSELVYSQLLKIVNYVNKKKQESGLEKIHFFINNVPPFADYSIFHSGGWYERQIVKFMERRKYNKLLESTKNEDITVVDVASSLSTEWWNYDNELIIKIYEKINSEKLDWKSAYKVFTKNWVKKEDLYRSQERHWFWQTWRFLKSETLNKNYTTDGMHLSKNWYDVLKKTISESIKNYENSKK